MHDGCGGTCPLDHRNDPTVLLPPLTLVRSERFNVFLVLQEIKKGLDPSTMQLHDPDPLLLDISPDLQQCLDDLVH